MTFLIGYWAGEENLNFKVCVWKYIPPRFGGAAAH